jgi:hypothetical protein
MSTLDVPHRGKDDGSLAGHRSYRDVHIGGNARAHLGDTYHNYGLQVGQSFAAITAEIHPPPGKL